MQAFGASATYTYVQNLSSIDVDKAGTGVTWDFSQFEADPEYTNFTLTITNPASTPYGANFPNSNYAYTADYGNFKQYSYFTLHTDSLFRLGSYNSNSQVLKTYSNYQTEYVFPLKLNASNNDTWMNNASTEGGEYNLSCAATGTLLLPGNKSYQAFFVKVHVTEPPLLNAMAYFWYDQKDGGILFHYFESDSWLFGSYAYYASNITTDLEASSSKEPSLSYNNPVQSSLTISGPSLTATGSYRIVDAAGTEVVHGEYTKRGASLELDCQSLNSGIYTLSFSSRDGMPAKPIRFVKL